MDTTLPSGYMFNPTDQQLVYAYLYNKANGRPLPCGAIKECDIYGDVSSWRNMFLDTEEECLHFFNRLNQKSGSSSRVGRATEFGTWKCQSDTKIYAGHLHIGSKRTFSFIEKKSKEERTKEVSKKTSGWIMHEYRLDGVLLHQRGPNSTDYSYVISKISCPRHMRRGQGESIASLIEHELNALTPVEHLQDNNILEHVEMPLDHNIDLDYDWSSYFLEDMDLDSFDFI